LAISRATHQPLLVLQSLIGGHKYSEAGFVGFVEQRAVQQRARAQLVGRLHLVWTKFGGQRCWRALIEQDPHSGNPRLLEAACSVVEYRAYMFGADTREPLQELIDVGAVLEVYEQRRHGHACAAENPHTAHAIRMPFYGIAF
jgi:hypothetical protein